MNARQGRRARDHRRQSGLHGAGGSELRERARQGRDARPPRSRTTTRPRSSATGTRPRRTTSSRGATSRAFDGTVSLIQPLIAPLYDGRQAIVLLSAMNGRPADAPIDLVKDYWTRAFGGKTKTRVDAARSGRQAVHELRSLLAARAARRVCRGHVDARDAGSGRARRAGSRQRRPRHASAGMEIVFRPDPTILDGRYANNGWLQELPKPLSKVTWDNVAYISPSTAEKLGIPVDRVPAIRTTTCSRSRYQGRKAQLPVWVLPGTADDVVVVHFGYGRRKAGRVGNEPRPRRVRAAVVGRAVVRSAARRSRRPARATSSPPRRTTSRWKAATRCASSTPRSTRPIRRRSKNSGPRSCRRRSRCSRRATTTATSGAWRST